MWVNLTADITFFLGANLEFLFFFLLWKSLGRLIKPAKTQNFLNRRFLPETFKITTLGNFS